MLPAIRRLEGRPFEVSLKKSIDDVVEIHLMLERSRYAERVSMLQSIEFAAFCRKELILPRIPDCKITKLGNLTTGNYLLSAY